MYPERRSARPPAYSVKNVESHIPFSLSTRSTTTTSFRPTRMSFWILRIRRLESSLNRIMPSILSNSSSFTYAPISAIWAQTCQPRYRCSTRATDEGRNATHLLDVHHDKALHLGELLLVEPAISQRHLRGRCVVVCGCGLFGRKRAENVSFCLLTRDQHRGLLKPEVKIELSLSIVECALVGRGRELLVVSSELSRKNASDL